LAKLGAGRATLSLDCAEKEQQVARKERQQRDARKWSVIGRPMLFFAFFRLCEFGKNEQRLSGK